MLNALEAFDIRNGSRALECSAGFEGRSRFV